MAGVNPFRRKHMQVLGLDNASFISSRTSRSSEDGSSTISHYSDRGSASSIHSRSNSVRKTSIVSPQESDIVEDNDYDIRRGSQDDDGHRFSYSGHAEQSPTDMDVNPFEEELDDDSLDELEDKPMALRRRRTVPSKAQSMLGANNDNPWRTSTRMGNHPIHNRSRSPDSTQIPMKAQKMLGLSKKGRLLSEDEYRRTHSLSPQTENVAPKAQRMLGIPSNPFSRPALAPGDRQWFGDELERHGSKGPTSLSRKPLDMDEFKRLIMNGERNFRDSTSNTDISSLSRSSILSSQPDTHIETPRSSHEFIHRPTLTRIATDSAVDTSAVLTEPWSAKPLSPVEMPGSSPILNKPLPKTPEHTFELAGSEPVSSSWVGGNKTTRAGVPESIAELPSEPVIYELPASAPPGSAAAPVELPAREASPIDPPFKTRSQNTHFAQLRTAPAVPPPRRGGSNRSSMEHQGSVESFSTAQQHLSSQSSESSLAPPFTSFVRNDPGHHDHSTTHTNPTASVSSPAITTQPPSPGKFAPAPPPPRRSGSYRHPSEVAKATNDVARPVTPTGRRPRANTDSPQSRLPPIQTTPQKVATPQGTPIADSMIISAVSQESKPFSPSGVSTMSPSSPASRKAGLNMIAKAAGAGETGLREKKSHELNKKASGEAIAKQEAKHQREWSWEPGKVDRIDSVKRGKSGLAEEVERMEPKQELEEVREDPAAEDSTEVDEHDTTTQVEPTNNKVDVLAGLDELKRDVDKYRDEMQDRDQQHEHEETGTDSPTKETHGTIEIRLDSRQHSTSESVVEEMEEKERNRVPEGNWI